MPTVKLPNGQTAQFPDGMSPQDIQHAIESDPSSGAITANSRGEGTYKMVGPDGSQVSVPFSGVRSAQDSRYQVVGPDANRYAKDAAAATPGNVFTSSHPLATLSANLHDAAPVVRDLGAGVVKGIANTGSNVLSGVASANSLPALAIGAGKLQDASRPTNTTQAIGRGIEQAGEFLIPGAAEEEAAGRLAPYVGKFAGKVIPSAAATGAVNAAQGGSFAGGALAGAAGGAIGQGMQAVAPKIAEYAMGIRATDRGFGRDIGHAILNETQGLQPGTVAQQARSAVSGLDDQLMQDAHSATGPVSLKPARDAASAAYGTAVTRNNEGTLKEIDKLNAQLNSRPSPVTLRQPIATPQTTGWAGLYQKPTATLPPINRLPIPQDVSAPEAIMLKRGVGDLENFNQPTATDFTSGVYRNVYGALDKSIDSVVPTAAGLNSRMSNLIPVGTRAAAKDLNAGITQRVIARTAAPTGALAAPLSAALAGGATHGPIGGAVAGIGTLVGQELLTNPTTLMTVARTANSPFTRRYALPALQAAGLQLSRGDTQ